jgi:hypothetical protein
LTELDANFSASRVKQQTKYNSTIEGRMVQVNVSLAEPSWKRSCIAGSTLLPFLRNTSLNFFAVKLLVPLFIVSTGAALHALGQTTADYISSSAIGQPDLPDAPSPSPAPQQSSPSNIPFLSPRFNQPHQPMDAGNKFKYLVEPAFGPRSFLTNGFSTGIRMANPPSHFPHAWRAGAEAFGRNYGDTFARTGAESIGRFSASVLLHEDPRYRRSESTFFPARLGHAFVFTFIDKTDGGHNTVAISNFTGAAASGFVGNAYLPPGFDNLTHAGQRSAVAFGRLAAQDVLQEFSPELGEFLKKIHLPHIPLPPVWWTGSN